MPGGLFCLYRNLSRSGSGDALPSPCEGARRASTRSGLQEPYENSVTRVALKSG